MKRRNPYPGLHRSPKRLADGARKVYFYAWKGGPPLPGEYGSPEFAAAYREAVARKVEPRQKGTLLTLLNAYQQSRGRGGSGRGFLDLAPRTRADYVKQIRKIEREFGDFPIAGLTDPRTRGVFLEWRDKISRRSERQADYAWTVLARVLSWALDRRMILANPCEKGGRIYHGSRAEMVWTEEDQAAFFAVASPEMRLAFMLAIWTGQRQGDLLRLPWSAYDGVTIRLTQSKGGARVAIPVGAPLRQVLEGTARRSPIILTNTKDQPWLPDGFRTAWRRATAVAGVSGLTFNDLRGTAVTRLARADCSIPQIASITGHKSAEINAILEKHYLASDPELARSAIRKLEAGTKAPNRAPNRKGDSGHE